ncbi:conjugal transfer protein TraF [Vibrio cyclitrophicus]|uniref:Type-F conjugative transfer system pilin assembly thiol-disulfide isomerase TrbB n=2 Tax=Vibrio cyclitrophicus TaxID=47951 RepID=A0A7Z1MKA5_9VIBR|nr:conjugal transfer protein TraF [Vibrio cyclitrophicus]PMP21140.1 hypothetical protein BCS91_20640 [Vibrio cyclitrophicus]PMP30512.1 hypothetical protein BCS90_14510 [Vibrio cyclitrophicus]
MDRRTLLKFMAGSALLNVGHSVAMTPILSDKYAVVFFFRSDCGYCHRFAPKLKQLEATTGIPVYDFSLDARPIPDFPTPLPIDQEILARFFPATQQDKRVPATFLMNVNSIKFVRMTVGDVSVAQLNESFSNIMNDDYVLQAIE